MACGSPVISTVNISGLDLFENGREGFIVPICDADALCEAMERLAGDPDLRASMAAAALAKSKN
jgi:starch synthase